MRARRLVLLALLLVAGGCTLSRTYTGGTLGRTELELLEDADTKAEVLEAVGPPDDMGLQLDGSVFIYRARREEFDELNLSFFQATVDYDTTDRRTTRLVVFFDKQGRKTGYGLDRATGED